MIEEVSKLDIEHQPVRLDRIQQLRYQIAHGQYAVSSTALAGKMLEVMRGHRD